MLAVQSIGTYFTEPSFIAAVLGSPTAPSTQTSRATLAKHTAKPSSVTIPLPQERPSSPEMSSRRPDCASMGSAAARPRENSYFISATGKIDAKVERFSNHSFLAWEVDIPAGREKSDANRFTDDFCTFFGLNYMTHLQDPERIPKVMWLIVANPDPVQDSINIPWVQAEPYDSKVDGANPIVALLSGAWESQMGKMFAPPLDARACNQRTQRRRGHDDDDDGGNGDYYQQRRRRARSIWARMGCKEDMNVHCAGARGRNTFVDSGGHRRYSSNMPSTEVLRHKEDQCAVNDLIFLDQSHVPVVFCENSSLDPMTIESNITSCPVSNSQTVDIPEALVQVNTVAPDRGEGDFNKTLENFLAHITVDLPQALLPTPPKVQHGAKNKFSAFAGQRSARLAAKNLDGKGTSTLALQVLAKKLGVASNSLDSNSQKLGTLFKQQLSPSAVHAIRELVAHGGDQCMLNNAVVSHGGSTSA
ncbi:hypothetical protein GUJ93_ZPchr0013g36518 [Zizania palustris]|uniref:Uncharacterized protein n=1 Tax=Zizania palustris TaxID=103762 RepID=A0A8J6C264_ZIZPA|nr:hypothetical protein GUJ93_ZPchr0013g36518 [Zizania palustris]